jgi:hypothetical protein
MATAITRTKTEIASIHAVEREHSRLFAASEALDAITRTTEQATSDILAAAEHIQESAWTLREEGANPDLCDDLDRRATEIYTACSFQDITAQRIAKIVHTLRYLEGRINAMIAIWDGGETALPSGAPIPPHEDTEQADDLAFIDLTQIDIDSVIVDEDMFGSASVEPEDPVSPEIAAEEPLPPASLPAPPERHINVNAFEDIDRLPTREKLRLFT